MTNTLKTLIDKFLPFAQKQMGFDRIPKINLKNDDNEANNPMGKTGFYDPNEESITIYIGKRHPKDIMRSLSHELMHHTQNCKGEFDNISSMGEQGYAQSDPHLRKMEIQAYQASIVFRDWEDSCKGTIYYEHLQKGENKMSTKDWKNKELTQLLSEAWGFKFNSLQEFEEFDGAGEVQEESEEQEVTQEVTEESEEQKDGPCKSGQTWEGDEMGQGKCVDLNEEEKEEELEEGGKVYTRDTEEEEPVEMEEAETPEKITKEHIEALVKKAIKEALQKRKGK